MLHCGSIDGVGVVYLVDVTMRSEVTLQHYPLRFRLYWRIVYGPAAIVVRPTQLLAAKHQAGAVPRFEGHFSRFCTRACVSEARVPG
jgi:hypothetical protein